MDVFYETFLPAGIEPAEMVLVVGIFFIAALIKGFLGIGLPAAAMAFLTLIMEPTTAISLMILPPIFRPVELDEVCENNRQNHQ